MKVDGACHCGSIRYEAEVDPSKVVICHCTDCQTLSGSAFRTVVPTNKGTFKLLSGQPKVYVKTGESGNKREQTFCPDCGSPIYSAPVEWRESRWSARWYASPAPELIPKDQYWFALHRHGFSTCSQQRRGRRSLSLTRQVALPIRATSTSPASTPAISARCATGWRRRRHADLVQHWRCYVPLTRLPDAEAARRLKKGSGLANLRSPSCLSEPQWLGGVEIP